LKSTSNSKARHFLYAKHSPKARRRSKEMEAIPVGFMATVPWLPKIMRIISAAMSLIGTLGVYTGIFFFLILYYKSPNPSPIELLWLFPATFYLGCGIPYINQALYNNRWSVIGNFVGGTLGAIVYLVVTIYGATLQWGVLSHCSNPTVGSFDVYFCAAKSFLDGFLSIIVISWVAILINIPLAIVDFIVRGILAGPRLPGQPDIPLVGSKMHSEGHMKKHHHPQRPLRQAHWVDEEDEV